MSNSIVTDCPNCKTPLVDGECPECGFKNTVVLHRVQVDTDTVAKNVKEQLQKEENADKAMQLFLKLKQDYSTQYPAYAELLSSCESPAELYDVIQQAQTETKTEEKKTPHGKAPFLPPSTGDSYNSQTAMIDSLYDKAFINSSKYPKEEVEDAKAKLSTLWESLIGSKSWSQLKEGGTRKIEQHKLSACPNCGFTLVDRSDCPNCGYDPTEKQKVVKTRTFKSPDSRGSQF